MIRSSGRNGRGIFHQHSWKNIRFGFLFSARPPSPLSREQCRFPWRCPRNIRARFPDEGFAQDLFPLVKFEWRGGKKGSRSYRYPWNRKLWRKFFERRSKAPLSLSSVFGTLCARLLSARATGERYKSSSSFVRGGCRVDKCPFVNQRRYLSSLSLSLFSLREATSNRTPDTFSFYLDLRELLFALGKNVARTMQPDTEYYFSYISLRVTR